MSKADWEQHENTVGHEAAERDKVLMCGPSLVARSSGVQPPLAVPFDINDYEYQQGQAEQELDQ